MIEKFKKWLVGKLGGMFVDKQIANGCRLYETAYLEEAGNRYLNIRRFCTDVDKWVVHSEYYEGCYHSKKSSTISITYLVEDRSSVAKVIGYYVKWKALSNITYKMEWSNEY